MADIDLKTETPDTTLPKTGFVFGADSQSAASPSVYTVQSIATTLLGSSTLTGEIVSTSSPVIDAAQEWGDSGVTFTGLKFNAGGSSDANSASGSLLMDLQVGGTSRLSVDKAGSIIWVGNSGRISSSASNGGISYGGVNNINAIAFYSTSGGYSPSFSVANDCRIGFSSTINGFAAMDTILTRRAAANLRLGAADTTGTTAPTPQFLSAQSWASSTNNDQPGANFTIDGSQGTGTGAGGSIIFRVAPAGSTSNGVQNALVPNFIVPATSGVARLVGTGTSANFSLASTINTNVTLTLRFNTSAEGVGGSVAGYLGRISGNLGIFNGSSGLVLGVPSGSTDSISIWGTDLRLARDTANTLAQRNGTNAQAFRVYNTYTSSTDFERANFFWDSNVLKIGTEKGSAGGTARALELQTDGTTRLTIAANSVLTHTASGGEQFTISTNGAVTCGRGITISATQSFIWNGRSLLASPADGQLTLWNNSANDFGRLNFGGTTSSFPALKRSSTTLQARLADDSDFGSIQGKLTAETAYTAGAPTATGYIVLYDSTGTAYKIPAEAL